MVFFRTRKIGENFYRYEERRKRVGGKVRSFSRYLGRVREEDKGLRFIERQIQDYPRQTATDPTNSEIKAAQEKAAPKDESGDG